MMRLQLAGMVAWRNTGCSGAVPWADRPQADLDNPGDRMNPNNNAY